MSDEMMRMMVDDELGAQPETGEMEVFMERGDERKRREREQKRRKRKRDGSEKKKTGCRVTGPGREGRSKRRK